MHTPDSKTLLDGRVEVTTLRVSHGPDPAAIAKRMLLPQGELTVLSPACPVIRFLAYLAFPLNGKRANHYHGHKTEFLYLVHGHLRLDVVDTVSRKRDNCDVSAGTLILIGPNIAHGYFAVEESDAIEFSAAEYDSTDTVQMKVI